MEYEIWADGKLIAQFFNITDRDFCMDELKDRYDDCKFGITEEESVA